MYHPTHRSPFCRLVALAYLTHIHVDRRGHTWQDLADSATSMARPWSILRALHLWKPSDRDWGYDLFTSATLRIANQQLGCDPGDLPTFISEVMVPLGTPEFLHGTIDIDQDEAWLTYLKETIQNFNNFLQTMNAVGYLVAAIILSFAAILVNRQDENGMNVIWNGILRILLTHGLVIALAVFTLHSVHSSKWAKDIASGKTLMRPFPTDFRTLEDPTVSEGKTTVPQRFDVLVGSRFDSPHIGMYSHWLDYHYGNRLFDDFVNTHGGRSFRSLPSNIAPCLIQAGVDLAEQRSGHFLQQDYRSGSWRQLNPSEVESFVKLQMVVGRDTVLDILLQEVNFMYGHNRFGLPSRKRISMSWLGQRQLDDLARRIFSVWLFKQPSTSDSSIDQSRILPLAFRLPLFSLPELPDQHRIEGYKKKEHFQLFDEVEYRPQNFGRRVFVGNIVGVNPGGGYNVAFYSRSVRMMDPVQYGIPSHMLRKRPPVVESGRVLGDFNGQGQLFPGQVINAWPDGAVDILYDDNDTELAYPGMYFMTT